MKSLIFASVLLLPLGLSAHEGHTHSLTATAKAAARVAVKAAETAVITGAAAVSTGAKAATKVDWPSLIKASIPSHMHNRLVHFPIALGLAGCLFLILSRKIENLRPGGRWLLFLAAFSSIVAIFTGRAMQDGLESAAAKQ